MPFKVATNGTFDKTGESLKVTGAEGNRDVSIEKGYTAGLGPTIVDLFYENWRYVVSDIMASSCGYKEMTRYEYYTLNGHATFATKPVKITMWSRYVHGYMAGYTKLRMTLKYLTAGGVWIEHGYKEFTCAEYWLSGSYDVTLPGTIEIVQIQGIFKCYGDSYAWCDTSSSYIKCTEYWRKG